MAASARRAVPRLTVLAACRGLLLGPGSAAAAQRAGFYTGRYLRGVGVDVDLAPVLDAPDSPQSFLGSRAFSEDPAVVASVGTAFAKGLQDARVAATAKHFPGLGTA